MDKSLYARLFDKRVYYVIQKSEELCTKCNYFSISPLVLFVSILILEKDHLVGHFCKIGLNYQDVCSKVEQKLSNIKREELSDYNFSEESLDLISGVILNKKYEVVTLLDLFDALAQEAEIAEILNYEKLYGEFDKEYLTCLYFDPVNGTFTAGPISYHDEQNLITVTEMSRMGGFA